MKERNSFLHDAPLETHFLPPLTPEGSLGAMSSIARDLLLCIDPMRGKRVLDAITSGTLHVMLERRYSDDNLRLLVNEVNNDVGHSQADAIRIAARKLGMPYVLDVKTLGRDDYDTIGSGAELRRAHAAFLTNGHKDGSTLAERIIKRRIDQDQVYETLAFLATTAASSLASTPLAKSPDELISILGHWLPTAFYDTLVLAYERFPDIKGNNAFQKLKNAPGHLTKHDYPFLFTGIGLNAGYAVANSRYPDGIGNWAYIWGPIVNSALSTLKSAHRLAAKEGQCGVRSTLKAITKVYRGNLTHMVADTTAVGLTALGFGYKLANGLGNKTPELDILMNSGALDTLTAMTVLGARLGTEKFLQHRDQTKKFDAWCKQTFRIAGEKIEGEHIGNMTYTRTPTIYTSPYAVHAI